MCYSRNGLLMCEPIQFYVLHSIYFIEVPGVTTLFLTDFIYQMLSFENPLKWKMSEQKSNIFTAEELETLSKCEKDTRFLIFHMNVLQFLGIYPTVTDTECHRFVKWLSIVITGALFFLSAFTTIAIVTCHIAEFTILEKLLSAMSVFAFLPLYAYKTLTNICRQISCEEIILSLHQFDDKCKARRGKNINEIRIRKIIFLMSRILMISYCSGDVIISTFDANTQCEYHINTYLYQTEMFYSFSIFTFLWELSDNLSPRYNYIKVRIGKLLKLHKDGHLSQNLLHEEFRDIKFLYKLLFNAVDTFNRNVGAAVLSALMYVQIAILVGMFWISFVVSFTSEMFIYNGIFIILSMVSFLDSL